MQQNILEVEKHNHFRAVITSIMAMMMMVMMMIIVVVDVGILVNVSGVEGGH